MAQVSEKGKEKMKSEMEEGKSRHRWGDGKA